MHPVQKPRVPLTPLEYSAKMLPASETTRLLETSAAVVSTADALATVPVSGSTSELATIANSSGLSVFGPPPSQGSGLDQLILDRNLLDKLLEPTELLEVFLKHDADPEVHTVDALAAFYEIQPELMGYLLKYCRPAVVVEHNGAMYGVYQLRSMHDV